ncbi:hypothetical protein BDR07DRAFT_1387091, partial [Suillus spraguei]
TLTPKFATWVVTGSAHRIGHYITSRKRVSKKPCMLVRELDIDDKVIQTDRLDNWQWLDAESGKQWIDTRSGQQWVDTESGREWLDTQSGRKWVDTESGRKWLHTESGRKWLDTESG